MLDTLVKSVENAFVQFNLRRSFYLLFLLGLVIGAVYIFDHYTDYSYYLRLEKRIDAVERLQEIQNQGVPSELSAVYRDMITSVQNHPIEPPKLTFSFVPLVKFLSASILFLIVALVGLIKRANTPNWDSVVIGGGLFGIILGIIGLLTPNIYSYWANVALYLFVQLLIAIAISKYGNRKEK